MMKCSGGFAANYDKITAKSIKQTPASSAKDSGTHNKTDHHQHKRKNLPTVIQNNTGFPAPASRTSHAQRVANQW